VTKLILGTASFGSDYGIKHDGQPSERELEHIARTAWDGGIRVIHTAWHYNLPNIWKAIFSEFEWMIKDTHPEYFEWNGRMGLSVYSLEEIQEFDGEVDMLQIPVNILDGRFKYHKFHPTWTVIARSVFLQGLLLMDEFPIWVPTEIQSKIRSFQAYAWMMDLQPYEAALGYVLGLDEIDKIIIGVNSAQQLEQLLSVKPLKWDYDFSITDENVLDPRRWPKEC